MTVETDEAIDTDLQRAAKAFRNAEMNAPGSDDGKARTTLGYVNVNALEVAKQSAQDVNAELLKALCEIQNAAHDAYEAGEVIADEACSNIYRMATEALAAAEQKQAQGIPQSAAPNSCASITPEDLGSIQDALDYCAERTELNTVKLVWSEAKKLLATPEARIVDDEGILSKLREVVKDHGNQAVAAKALGISASYLNDVLQEKRAITEKVAALLGWRLKKEWVPCSKPTWGKATGES